MTAPTSAPHVPPAPAIPPPNPLAIRGSMPLVSPIAWLTASDTDSAQLKPLLLSFRALDSSIITLACARVSPGRVAR